MFIDAKQTEAPSARRAMFIDAKQTEAALRQEGHVSWERLDIEYYVALLTEGEAYTERTL